jgi:hypothetical protein
MRVFIVLWLGMNLDEDKPIDVNVRIRINQKMLISGLLAVCLSIFFTGLLLYYFASELVTVVCSIIVGLTLLFFSVYFPVQSSRFFLIDSEVVDIEEEELEELQSIMKPW